MVWQKNGTPSTLTGTASSITISDLTAKKFNQFIYHTLQTGNGTDIIRFDNNSATDYAFRESTNGGADSTSLNETKIQIDLSSLGDQFTLIYGINITSQEKLTIAHHLAQVTAGATNAPQRQENVGKMDTTTSGSQYTRIDIVNNHGTPTDYAIGSNLSALGTDGGEVNYIIQNGAIFHETDTNKIYQYSSTTDSWTLLS